MRSHLLETVLSDLNGASADVEASAVISSDGLLISALLPSGMDEDRVGAMSAAMLSLGDRTASELTRGDLELVLIKGEYGYVMMMQAGPDAVLTAIAKANAKLGMVFLDVRRAAKAIGSILG